MANQKHPWYHQTPSTHASTVQYRTVEELNTKYSDKVKLTRAKDIPANVNNNNKNPQCYRIAIVGDGAVGKSSLLMSYFQDQSMKNQEYIPTVWDQQEVQYEYKDKMLNFV